MPKKINGFLKIGFICIFISIIVIIIGISKSQSVGEKLSKLPVISDEKMLSEALSQAPKKYIIMNAPLSGEVCEDTLGILADEYLYLEYSSHYFTYRSRNDDSMTYDTSWDLGDTHINAGKNLCIYENIPLEADSYKMHCNYTDLTEAVKPEFYDKIAFENAVSYYYPGEIGDFENNKRYSLRGLLQGQEVAFIALVGDGKVVLSSLNDGSDLPISAYNDMASLEYAQDESVGSLGLIGLAFFALGVIMVIMGIIDILGKIVKK